MTRTIGLLALAAAMMLGTVPLAYPGGSDSERKVETEAVAWLTVDGKLMKIDGEFYVIEDSNGKELRLHVSRETKQLGGEKKPGDKIRAEITRSGHALSIQ